MLKHFDINLDRKIYDKSLSKNFNKKRNYITEYISRYLAQQKINYKKINSLSLQIDCDVEEVKCMEELKTIRVFSSFPFEKISNISDDKQRDELLQIIEANAEKYNHYIANISIVIIDAISLFRKDDYKNIWIFKKRKINGIGTAKLTCELTPNEFILWLIVVAKDNTELYRTELFREFPDLRVSYDMYKDLKIKDEKIIVYDRNDCEFYSLSLSDIVKN